MFDCNHPPSDNKITKASTKQNVGRFLDKNFMNFWLSHVECYSQFVKKYAAKVSHGLRVTHSTANFKA